MKEIDKFSAQRGGHRTKWPPGSLYKRGSVSCVQTDCQDFCTHCVQNGCQNVVHAPYRMAARKFVQKYVVRVKAPPPSRALNDAGQNLKQLVRTILISISGLADKNLQQMWLQQILRRIKRERPIGRPTHSDVCRLGCSVRPRRSRHSRAGVSQCGLINRASLLLTLSPSQPSSV